MTRKKMLLFALPVMLLAGAYILYRKVWLPDDAGVRNTEPVLAVYYRDSTRLIPDFAALQHLALRWNNSSGKGVSDELRQSWPKQPALLTLEIWPPALNRYVGKKQILDLIIRGEYDEKIKELGAFLARQQAPVLLRLNPEMEVHVERYPWQMTSPSRYRESFRHVAQLIRKTAPGVQMVWAPAGYPGTEEYWPGKEFVDVVSVTLKSGSEGMTDKYPDEKTLTGLIARKLHRTRFFDRPVLVMGSARLPQADFRRADFDSAAAALRGYAEVEYNMLNALDQPLSPDLLRKDGSLLAGVYDPDSRIIRDVQVELEHLFVNLERLKSGRFAAQADSVRSRNHALIVTMEPWKDKQLQKDPLLIQNILSGKYDTVLQRMTDVLRNFPQTVYLRWLHEMEIPIKRYPWQSQEPLQYIRAYRYFVDFVRRQQLKNIYFVWGPAGDRGSMEFFPGRDVVDFVSIAIYGLPDKNITDHRRQESFNDIFIRKYNRLWMAHLPIFITEFGVKGPPEFKQEWLNAAAGVVEKRKEIVGLSYFNDADAPKAWGDIEAPDWSITADAYTGFLKKLVTARRQP